MIALQYDDCVGFSVHLLRLYFGDPYFDTHSFVIRVFVPAGSFLSPAAGVPSPVPSRSGASALERP